MQLLGYDNRIWGKYTVKWGTQIAGMFFKQALVCKRGSFGSCEEDLLDACLYYAKFYSAKPP